jgi:hypothetical protein
VSNRESKQSPANTQNENGGNSEDSDESLKSSQSSDPLREQANASDPINASDPKVTSFGKNYEPPADAVDLSGLYQNTGQGDPLASTRILHIPARKPRGYFMVPPNSASARSSTSSLSRRTTPSRNAAASSPTKCLS